MACKESDQDSTPTSGKNMKHISNSSLSKLVINLKNVNESEKTTLKLKSSIEKIKDSVINNWMESGFIENIRGQIRCQLIRELKNPFKHQRNVGRKSINHLSLTRRILNSIIIDYLTKYRYNYALSVFKSEIGGELIGSLSDNDTYDQLQLNYNSKMCILEQLIHYNKNNSINLDYKTNEKPFEISPAKKEKICVKELKLIEMNEPSKFKELESESNMQKKKDIECNEKYDEIYKELMNALKRENELKCLLDEGNIKLKSAKREIKYLEQLLVSQNNDNNHHIYNNNNNKCNEILVQHKANEENEQNRIIPNVSNVATQKNDTNNVWCDKYKDLELDLKKRLQIQATLETDTRKLTYHTKQFFNQLNQHKTQTTQIIHKLQNSTPKFDDKFIINKNANDFIEINAEKKEEFELEKRKNRQSFIYYNLDKLKKERNEIQQQIRNKIKIQQIPDYKESDIDDNDNDNEIKECNDFKIQKDEFIVSDDSSNKMELESVSSNTQTTEQDDNDDKPNILNDIKDNVIESDDLETILPIIDEDKEHLIVDIATQQANTKNEWDILEKEKLEQELMDDDFTQSESFSGIDFLQTDFLDQYQKHIENMNKQ